MKSGDASMRQNGRRAVYSISFLYSFTDLLVNKDSNGTAAEFVRQKIRATVKDPKTAELLCPNDHPIGTKRLILDTDYYETYNRDNVTLVDIRSKPIKEITATGLRTEDAEYALDTIVFATGFDAMTGAMKEIDIRTNAGLSIGQKWQDGPRDVVARIGCGCRPGLDRRRLEPHKQPETPRCHSNTTPNTVIISRNRAIGSRTGRNMTRPCDGEAV
jgi:hypothetical protein